MDWYLIWEIIGTHEMHLNFLGGVYATSADDADRLTRLCVGIEGANLRCIRVLTHKELHIAKRNNLQTYQPMNDTEFIEFMTVETYQGNPRRWV